MADIEQPSGGDSEPPSGGDSEPPATMETDDPQLDAAEPMTEGEPSDLDLRKTAQDYAEYLVVNSKQDKQVLDERVQSVVFRVEEFKQQLDHMHQNITSCSDKTQEVYEHMQQLRELFQRIDQVEAFLGVVSTSVDQLEESISQAERELDPSKLRKVFSALPKLRKGSGKADPLAKWQPPQVFRTGDHFSHHGQKTQPPPPQLKEPEANPQERTTS